MFEGRVALYKDRVFVLAYRLMGNRDDAEDQAQEVFLKVYRGIKNLDDLGTVTTWIYRIATNTCFDALSKQKRRPHYSHSIALPPTTTSNRTSSLSIKKE